MELGDIIKELRGTRTQSDFAASIGAKKQQVSDWERGVYKPDPTQLQAMGITIRYDLDTKSDAATEREVVYDDSSR